MRARSNWCERRREGSHLRGPGAEIRSVLEQAQLESHLAAGAAIDRIVREAFLLAAQSVREKKSHHRVRPAAMDAPEICRGGHHHGRGAGCRRQCQCQRPALRATREKAAPIREGDLLLLDVWGKQKAPGSVYYDITWVGYLGAKVPEKYVKIFERGSRGAGPRRGTDSLQREGREAVARLAGG